MLYRDGDFVYDTEDWYYCDHELLDTFGVTYLSKLEFRAAKALQWGIKFDTNAGYLIYLDTLSCKRLVLSDICRGAADTVVPMIRASEDCVMILDDHVIERFPHLLCTLDLTAVTDDWWTKLIYNLPVQIIDNAERYRVQCRQAYVTQGLYRGNISDFTPAEDSVFVEENLGYFIQADHRLHNSDMAHLLPKLELSDDLYAALNALATRFDYLNIFRRYFAVGGKDSRVLNIARVIVARFRR